MWSLLGKIFMHHRHLENSHWIMVYSYLIYLLALDPQCSTYLEAVVHMAIWVVIYTHMCGFRGYIVHLASSSTLFIGALGLGDTHALYFDHFMELYPAHVDGVGTNAYCLLF